MHSNSISLVQKSSLKQISSSQQLGFELIFFVSVGLKASSKFLSTFSFDSRVYVSSRKHRSMINRVEDSLSNPTRLGSSFSFFSIPSLSATRATWNFKNVKSSPNCLQNRLLLLPSFIQTSLMNGLEEVAPSPFWDVSDCVERASWDPLGEDSTVHPVR